MSAAVSLGDAVPRWAPRLLLGVAVLLVPWSIWLLASLPQRHLARHWAVAWTGFDVALAVALALTAYGLTRRPTLVAAAGPVAATLLVCDAWFDATMSADDEQLAVAVGLALCVELPLAAFCVWLTHRPRGEPR